MLDAHAAGGLSTDELLATYGFLFFAGYETTTTLISNGVLALLRHPDQMRRLRDDPALITTAVEEFLRYASPTQILWRTVLADVDMLGCAFRKNQRVELLTGAANRDPERFAEPDQLKVDRKPNPHLGFGQGIHYCLGAYLARLEVEVAVSTLINRLPRLALLESLPEWEATLRLRRLKTLWVSF